MKDPNGNTLIAKEGIHIQAPIPESYEFVYALGRYSGLLSFARPSRPGSYRDSDHVEMGIGI